MSSWQKTTGPILMPFTWTKRLTYLTPLILVISIMTAGAGHGTQIPTLICYPVLFCFGLFEDATGVVFWLILLGQFPLYGLIIDLARRRTPQLIVAAIIILIHTAVIIIALRNRQPESSAVKEEGKNASAKTLYSKTSQTSCPDEGTTIVNC